jgi:hypothetical protein
VARPVLTDLSLARGARHVKTANGTEIHANTTINTGVLIDLKTIGHADLLQGNFQCSQRLLLIGKRVTTD